MKRIFTLAVTLCYLSISLAQAQTHVQVTDAERLKPIIVDLWPNGAPNDNGLTGPEKEFANGRIGNVSKAALYVYPAGTAGSPAIIACPGGGYSRLAMNHEGHDMATWFNKQGITYAVLKYRMPNGDITIPLSDAQQAICIMRERAAEWNIDPTKVGVMGGSAGGNLAAQTATQFTSKENRPDFQVLLYPFLSMNEYMSSLLLKGHKSEEAMNKYWAIKQVKEDTPPAFIVCSADDKTVPCSDSVDYFTALRKNKISAALFIYPTGDHGWGYKESMPYKREWTAELERWLQDWKR